MVSRIDQIIKAILLERPNVAFVAEKQWKMQNYANLAETGYMKVTQKLKWRQIA